MSRDGASGGRAFAPWRPPCLSRRAAALGRAPRALGSFCMGGATVTGLLLERREELARIESALAEARSGRGRFVVIEGPSGIGKTALLAAARTAAGDGGMRVLRS